MNKTFWRLLGIASLGLLAVLGFRYGFSTFAASPDDSAEQSIYGDMPVMIAEDGSIVPDPNALGLGPEGTTPEPSMREELAANLAAIPDSRKLVLDGGNVIAVASTCTYPENYDPTKRCVGLHDIAALSVITLDREGNVLSRTKAVPNANHSNLERIIENPQAKEQILEFLEDASVD